MDTKGNRRNSNKGLTWIYIAITLLRISYSWQVISSLSKIITTIPDFIVQIIVTSSSSSSSSISSSVILQKRKYVHNTKDPSIFQMEGGFAACVRTIISMVI